MKDDANKSEMTEREDVWAKLAQLKIQLIITTLDTISIIFISQFIGMKIILAIMWFSHDIS